MKHDTLVGLTDEAIDKIGILNRDKFEQDLKKEFKANHFAELAKKEIDRLWETGELNDEKVESFRHLHERTPYK